MNILVTGGSGFIGSHVVDKLVEAGQRVRVIDLKKPEPEQDVEFFKGDITSRDDVRTSLVGMDIVYHIAAFSNIDLVKDNPLTTVERNILGTAYLLEECRRQSIKRFIFASSIYVYEERGHIYTTCKISSELLCQNYYRLYSLPYTILRYGTAYGPRSRGADVISLFVRRALAGENLIIRGSGEQERPFIYVEDLALGNLAALNPVAENKTYNLVGKKPLSVNEIAKTIRETFDNKIAIEHDFTREDDYEGKFLSSDKAKQELDWEPKVDFKEGLKRYIEWYKRSLESSKTA